MPIYFGGNKIKEIYNGSVPIKEVYNGSNKVFGAGVFKYCVLTYTQSWAPNITLSMNTAIFPNIQTSTTYLQLYKYSEFGYNTYVLSNYKPLESVSYSFYGNLNVFTTYYVKTVNINGIDFELYRGVMNTVEGVSYTRFYIPKGFILNQSIILFHFDSNKDEDYYVMDSRTSTTFVDKGTTYTIARTEEIDVLTGEEQ